MALRDTLWITDSHFIETKHESIQEVLTTFFGQASTYRRLRTIVDGEWVALTETAATNYADTHAGDTNTKYVATEDNRYCDAWKLSKHVETKGQWVLDT